MSQNRSGVGVLSGVATVVFCILLFLYGRPIFGLLYTRWESRKTPKLWVVPTPLADLSIDQSVGKKFSYLGYEFESPWTQVKKERKSQSIAVLNFADGQFISISRGVNTLEAMQEGATKRGADIRNIFGHATTASNYALFSKILYLTPRDLRLSWSRKEMVADSVLLTIKGIQVAWAKGGLYSFQTESVRGFQEGSPTYDNAVHIDAFDGQDRDIWLMIGAGPKPNGRRISQAEINRILYSLHIDSSSPGR
jgi:hypothetical protein